MGMAAARALSGPRTSALRLLGSMTAWSTLSLLPDADVLGFAWGIAYGDPFGHRGASHSLACALGVGLCSGVLLCALRGHWLTSLLAVTAVVASHGLLDTLTDGGLGCALYWPFDDRRVFAPWRPIPVAPIGAAFFTSRGLEVAAVEALLFSPLLIYALWPRPRRARTRDAEGEVP